MYANFVLLNLTLVARCKNIKRLSSLYTKIRSGEVPHQININTTQVHLWVLAHITSLFWYFIHKRILNPNIIHIHTSIFTRWFAERLKINPYCFIRKIHNITYLVNFTRFIHVRFDKDNLFYSLFSQMSFYFH